LSYEGLAWVTGAAVMAAGAMPAWPSLTLAALYSAGAHGIMTLNDFKAIEGDRRMGIASLPVQLGPRGAALAACATMVGAQIAVVGLLLAWARPWHALAIVVLLFGQLLMMRRFVAAPIERALWLSGLGVPLFVAGMMVSAFAVRGV
jgi:chlorophyll synthase